MTKQEEEIRTIKPRNYTIKLSDADVERLAKTAGAYGITASELLENFIGDLVSGTYSNGSDERMYAEQWAERCWFALNPEKNLIHYLCDAWEYDFDTLTDILDRIKYYEAYIIDSQNSIANPNESDWKEIVHHKYSEDGTSYESIPCYNTVEEYIASEKECLEDYKESLSEAQSELKDIQDSFNEYMHGKEYAWEEEVEKALKWYKENITDKL